MSRTTEAEYRKQLETEGFLDIIVWEDRPGAHYPDHTHEGLTAHIVLEGEITLAVNGTSRTFRAGERCDVPAGATHSAFVGPQGCRYVIGEK
jgi:quercetin dioxygenase-like cupin family protein